MTEDVTLSSATHPRVAILSPYYKRASAVEKTFHSIAAQTYQNFEAIIWDDHSPDNTWEKMQSVVNSLGDQRFRIFQNEENLGLTRGLNNALTLTSSEYIAIVGSGDECHPDRIKRQVQVLDERPDAVFCATASKTYDPVADKTFFDSRHSGDTIRLTDLEYKCPFTHGSVMYRASALRSAGGYEETFKWCADWDMFIRILRLGDAAFIPEVLYWRVAQIDGVSFDPRKSFEQIRSKRLVLKLSRTDENGRTALLERVRAEGIENVLDSATDYVARDVSRRNIKLYLMGRTSAGDEMLRLAREQQVQYPATERRLIWIARLLGQLPLNSDLLIRAARAVSRRGSGARKKPA